MPETDDRPVPPDAPAEIRDLLADLLEWRLPPLRWTEVEALLGALGAALRTDDGAGVRAAVLALELASPTKIIRITGATAPGPPPPPVRERANVLIHDLGRPPRGPAPAGEPRDR